MQFLSLALFALVFAPSASAQVSIGGQAGDPTGLALKFGQGQGAILTAIGWDLSGDDRINVEGHYMLRMRGLRSNRQVRLFYGPGVFASFGENRATRGGISLGIGLETDVVPDLELYGLLSPRLQLVDETEFDLGGGVGLRLRL